MDGQVDLFDLLDKPARTFTVYAGRSQLCSWCGETRYLTGGGCHTDTAGNVHGYAFCDPCKETYGRLEPGQPITYKKGDP